MALRVTQTGVALTVGIVFVAILVVGGFMWAKHDAEVARKEETIKIASEQLEDSSNDVAISGEDATSDKSDDTTKTEDTGDKTPSNETTTEGVGNGVANNSTDTETTELPHTGPANSFMTLVALFALTFATVAYMQSRQAVARNSK